MNDTLDKILNQSTLTPEIAEKIRNAVVEYKGFKMTPLLIAIENNKPEMVKVLLENGADINFKNKLIRESDRNYVEDGLEPIHYAAKSGNLEILKLLEDSGADVNKPTKDSRMTPLFYAIASKNLELVMYLSKKTSNTNHLMAAGYNAINYALSSFSSDDIIEYLIEQSFDVNNVGAGKWTPLLSAVAMERYGLAELLIKNKANVKAQTEAGWNIGYLTKNKTWLEQIKLKYSQQWV